MPATAATSNSGRNLPQPGDGVAAGEDGSGGGANSPPPRPAVFGVHSGYVRHG